MTKVAAEPIELPDDKGVALAQRLQRSGKPWPIVAPARGAAFIDVLAGDTGGAERIALQIVDLTTVGLRYTGVERTLFMLDWLDDPDALARAVFFNRLGELRNRTFENQRHRASGLNLVASAIILWNTVYLDRAVHHLRGQGVDSPNDLLAHGAPLGWEHVSLTGDYLWSEIDKPRERFRPLRTSTSAGRA